MFSSTYDRAKCYIDLPKPKKEKFTVDLFCIATFNSNIQESNTSKMSREALFSDKSIIG